jgi:hypothetical protein
MTMSQTKKTKIITKVEMEVMEGKEIKIKMASNRSLQTLI